MPKGISFDYYFLHMDDDLEVRKESTRNAIAMYTVLMENMNEDGSFEPEILLPFLRNRTPLEIVVAMSNIITGLLAEAGEGLEPLQRVAIVMSER